MDKKTFKIFIIFGIILLVALLIYFIFFHSSKKNEEYTHLKNYKSNEYIPTYVSHGDMAKIYLNDYIYYMRYDQKKAYELLDSDYRTHKFNSFDEYKLYANKMLNLNQKIEKFSKYNKGEYIFYKLYLEKDRIIVFKTKGVMQYRVYLDEDTVEIG